jgi:hypothetical protein
MEESMEKEFIFQNVNINSINFTNNRNDIKFEFLDSISGSGKRCGELICESVLSFNMSTDLDDDSQFPQFICDVSNEVSPDIDSRNTIKLQGGSYDITLICKNVEILKL